MGRLLLITILLFLFIQFICGHDHSHEHNHSHDHDHDHSHSHEEESKIIELNLENFYEVIDNNPFVVVEFYAPWCGACKKFAPEYEAVAEHMEGLAVFAKMNAWNEEYVDITRKYEVSGYPTIIFFQNGDHSGIPYNGHNDGNELVETINKKIRVPIIQIKDIEVFTKFSTSERVVIVGFFDDTSSPEWEKFSEIAKKLKEQFLFGAVVGDKQMSAEYHAPVPGVIMFQQFEEGDRINLPGSKFDELEKWIFENMFPLVADISKENQKIYVKSGIPIGFFFVNTQEERNHFEPILKELAVETRNKLNFVFIDWTKYGNQAKKLALSGTKVPCFAIENTTTQLHYAFNEQKDLTLENLRDFVQSYLKGNLSPTLVSEPLPESNEGPVKIVVGNNYKDIVLDDTKDVFLELYAPWCGHCKNLIPVWEQLGEAFKNNPNVVIAKMDATANFFDKNTKVNMFPTLKIFKAGDKENPVQYKGDKKLDSLIAFVKEHSRPVTEKAKDEL